MRETEILSIAKNYLLNKFEENNKEYPLTPEALICTNFEEYQWKEAHYRFDIAPLFDLLYLPCNSTFIMAYRFLVDGLGNNVQVNPIYTEGNNPLEQPEEELPFYPGTSFFQTELDKINISLLKYKDKTLPATGDRIEKEILLSWHIKNLEDLKECETIIKEDEDSYILKHKLVMGFLLEDGKIPDSTGPHSWCEYKIDKRSGDISRLTLFDKNPPCLL